MTYRDPDGWDGPPLPESSEEYAHTVTRISDQIKPILKGHHPLIQSGVLAELLSLWLAGIGPHEARKELYKEHLKLVDDLVLESEKELFGKAGHPANRQ